MTKTRRKRKRKRIPYGGDKTPREVPAARRSSLIQLDGEAAVLPIQPSTLTTMWAIMRRLSGGR